MEIRFSDNQVVVYDDVLSSNDFQLVWHYVETEEYRTGKGTWDKVYRLIDGSPMEGALVLAGNCTRYRSGTTRTYPTGTAIDLLIDFLNAQKDNLAPWLGKYGHDWDIMSARSSLYPAGVALSWHVDSTPRTGSYVFYAHKAWNAQWGGELFVAAEPLRGLDYPEVTVMGKGPQSIGGHLDNSFESDKLMEIGVGTFIAPKPNRLVVLSGGSLHKINRVDVAAGSNVRCSISGFMWKDS